MSSLSKPGGRRVFEEIQSKFGVLYVQTWSTPAAASAALLLSAQSIAAGGTVTSFLAQPDVPRNLQVVASGAATGNVVVTGTNIRGAVITETLALNGATPVLGAKAFASVTSVVLPTVSATTINLGTGVKLGLERMLAADLVVATSVNGAYEATRPTVVTSTSAIESNTIVTNTAPNGSKAIICAYVTKEKTAAKRVTT
jgi:hypothetical protein